ncbi:hypothetical protein C8R47DRAFT_999749, partial [Mycena vitilis]
RPAQLSAWVRAGRGVRPPGPLGNGVGPAIQSLAVYDAEWWRWWASFQPNWRTKDSGTPGRFLREAYPQSGKDAWEDMRRPGPNGALSFVATLYWWGKEVQRGGEREDRESWAEAVRDVRWMLKGLLMAESLVG